MKNIVYIKIAAVVAAGIGLMAVVAGSKVLTGASIPEYNVLPWLVKYNVTMGILSVVTGIVLWLNHRFALKLTGFVGIAHMTVLVLLLTVFGNTVAAHSINAMIFRSVIWIVLFVIVWKKSIPRPIIN